MPIEFCDNFSVALCRENPDKIYVFGDNLIGKGKRGQAVIRDEPNAFGIPTKRLPCLDRDTCFFSDKEDEFIALTQTLGKLWALKVKGHTLVFPSNGLGTGLAQMNERSPRLYRHMRLTLAVHFGIEEFPYEKQSA